MVDVKALKNKMESKNVRAEEAAAAAGVNLATFYRKMKSGNFLVKEAAALAEKLGLDNTEAAAIFFARCVA